MVKTKHACVLKLGLMVTLLLFTVDKVGSEVIPLKAAVERDIHFTPVVMSVLAEPYPFRGSDGWLHFVYELHLTNATRFPVKVQSVEILDANQGKKVMAAFSGEGIPQKMQDLITKAPTDTLQGGKTAIFFIHFKLEKIESQLRTLAHRLTISGDFPPGFYHFMGMPESEKRIVEIGGLAKIQYGHPIVIGPPLEGEGWIAADGCCTAKRHIRAIMPINGRLRIAQRFAIDWELMNEKQQLFVGDPSNVNSYFSYGQKVFAVADSTVVSVVDEFNDQVPGKLPQGMTLAEADGNHIVLDLGNDRYAFYAHFKPGSITAQGVKVGDRVCRGQVLGLVGNSGNTTAPHLHFHVMSSPSTLGSIGLPYVIERFELGGKVSSTAAFVKAEQAGTPLAIQEVSNPGNHSDELPLDLSVLGFPAPQKCAS